MPALTDSSSELTYFANWFTIGLLAITYPAGHQKRSQGCGARVVARPDNSSGSQGTIGNDAAPGPCRASGPITEASDADRLVSRGELLRTSGVVAAAACPGRQGPRDLDSGLAAEHARLLRERSPRPGRELHRVVPGHGQGGAGADRPARSRMGGRWLTLKPDAARRRRSCRRRAWAASREACRCPPADRPGRRHARIVRDGE